MEKTLDANSPGPLKVSHALSYLDAIQKEYGANSPTYLQFLTVMQNFHYQKCDTSSIIQQTIELFKDKPHLLQGFNTFLPSGYSIATSQQDSNNVVKVLVVTPEGKKEHDIQLAVQSSSLTLPSQAAKLDSSETREKAPRGSTSTGITGGPSEASDIEWMDGHTTKIPLPPAPTLPAGYSFYFSPPTLEPYLHLRRASGLTPVSPTQGARSLKGGWYGVHITYKSSEPKSEEQVVAMGRIIGDGGWYFHVCDMAVLPEHQRKGLGAAILGALLQRMKDVAEPGYVCNLLADPPGVKLYSKFGFVVTPDELGMTQWIGGKGENKGEGWWRPTLS